MRRPWLPALALSLAASHAGAVGGFAADPPATTLATEVRAAVAAHEGGSTVWVAATLEGAADRVVWVVPVAPGTAVDRGSSAFFDALEDATAPRIVGPNGCASEAPVHVVETRGDHPPPTPDLESALVSDPAALEAQLAAWGVLGDDLPKASLAAAVASGKKLLAVLMHPEPGTRSTRTLRLSGATAELPLAVFQADATSSVSGSLFAVGDGRATLAGFPSAVVASAQVKIGDGASNYATLRDAFLSQGRVVIDSASRASLTRSHLFPGGHVPSVADAFLVRAYARGELPIDLGKASDGVHATYETLVPVPCAKGELVPAPCSSSDPLAKLVGPSSDLAFALAGTASGRTLTRFTFVVPKGKSAALPMPSFEAGDELSPLRFVPEPQCKDPNAPAGGGAPIEGHRTSAGDDVRPDEGEEGDASHVSVEVGVDSGCDGSSSDSCSSDSSEGGSSCSSDSSGGGNSCSSDSSGGGGDSCSKDSGGGDSCSGDSGGGDSCSSSSGGGGGDSCSGGGEGGGGGCDCAVPKRKQKPAVWIFVALALAFPLRRATRPKARRRDA